MNVNLSFFSMNGLGFAITVFNFPEDYKYRPDVRVKALRYLFNHRKKYPNTPSIELLRTRGRELFDELRESNNLECLREIADVMLEFGTIEQKQNFLNDLTTIEEKQEYKVLLNNNNPGNLVLNPSFKTKNVSVYHDRQNVHDTFINKSVIKALKYLYEQYKINIILDQTDESKKYDYKVSLADNIQDYMIKQYTIKKQLIEESFQYILTSTAVYGDEEISLLDCFLCLWFWISEHKNKKDLENRLLEEFQEMKGQCSTGHLSRLINVIQGFTDDENLTIRISNKEQIKSAVTFYLNKKLQECTDEKVLDEMIDMGENYIKFIRKCVSEKILDWKKDYGQDSLTTISTIVNNFCKAQVFTI